MTRSRLAPLALAAALGIGVLAGPAGAAGPQAKGQGHSHPAPVTAKKVKTFFVATGVISSVDAAAGTVTVVVKGGSRDLHGTTQTFSVSPDAVIELDDATATLADLGAGDHASIRGTRNSDGSFTATRISASSPEPEDDGDSDGDVSA